MFLVAAAVVVVGATLQSMVGFGIGIVVVPLLLWQGWELPHAVVFLAGAAFVQVAYGTWVAREEIRWRHTLGTAAAQMAAYPLGILCMTLLVGMDPGQLRQAVGVAILALLTVRLFAKPTPRDAVHPAWAGLAGSTAGFLGGLIGMPGPPLVVYAMAHNWNPMRFRGFLWSQFMLVLPVGAVAFGFTFGFDVVKFAAYGIATAPALWLGTKIGLKVSASWDEKRLRIAAAVVLYAIAISSIVMPLLSA